MNRVIVSNAKPRPNWHHDAIAGASMATTLRDGRGVRDLLAVMIDRHRDGGSQWTTDDDEAAVVLAHFAFAATRRDGTAAFGDRLSDEIARNVGIRHDPANTDPFGADGLLALATRFDPEPLDAALGRLRNPKACRKLVDEIDLPETMLWDEPAGKFILSPRWGGRRGRVEVDTADVQMRMFVGAGVEPVVDGIIQTDIKTRCGGDTQTHQPVGEWEVLCSYTDDEVHYGEWQQNWSGDLWLQRQVMVIREDSAVMIADTVTLPPKMDFAAGTEVTHTLRLPRRRRGDHDDPATADESATDDPATDNSATDDESSSSLDAPGLTVVADPDVREYAFLRGDRPDALMLPLAAPEWREFASNTTVQTDERSVRVTTRSAGRIFMPLWFDLRRRRMGRVRTWRRLTVMEQLDPVRPDHAAAFRVQFGMSQWMIYRSLVPGRLRSVLGRHMAHDFLATRFDSADGIHEELVTVEE